MARRSCCLARDLHTTAELGLHFIYLHKSTASIACGCWLFHECRESRRAKLELSAKQSSRAPSLQYGNMDPIKRGWVGILDSRKRSVLTQNRTGHQWRRGFNGFGQPL